MPGGPLAAGLVLHVCHNIHVSDNKMLRRSKNHLRIETAGTILLIADRATGALLSWTFPP
jgi:hypothetical protein